MARSMSAEKTNNYLMAEENDKTAGGTRRFRLPKLFAEADGENIDADNADNETDENGGARPLDNEVTAQVMAQATQGNNDADTPAPRATTQPAPHGESGDDDQVLEYVASMAQELLAMRDALSHMTQQIEDMNQRESTQEKVFDTLHAELGDYKKDFIYERLKPVVRPLLFLYDSLEQFDDEIAQHERPDDNERRGLSPRLVRENVVYFRDQLVEALHVCQVTQMDTPRGVFNAKLHKAMGVEDVPNEQHGHIMRVLRSGWYLNGQLLRPAEVIVGKGKDAVSKAAAVQSDS